MDQRITEIERKILDFMVHYLRSNTYQPSIREIGERFGIKSTKTVSEHLQALADKGFLERDPSRSRGVKILGEIREDLRGVRNDLRLSTAQAREDLGAFRSEANDRFELLETTLRDLAPQMVMLGRAVRVAIEGRDTGSRLDDLDHRVADLERRAG